MSSADDAAHRPHRFVHGSSISGINNHLLLNPACARINRWHSLDDAVLHNTNQFHKWHTELEAACALEQEEKYKRYADLLNSHLKTCESILVKVCASDWLITVGAL